MSVLLFFFFTFNLQELVICEYMDRWKLE